MVPEIKNEVLSKINGLIDVSFDLKIIEMLKQINSNFQQAFEGMQRSIQPIQNFITARAATIVSGRIVGDDSQYARLQQQEIQSRALAMEYETSQGQFTMFGHPQGSQNYYQSYQPFHALQR